MREGSEHVRDARLHFDHVLQNHFPLILILSVQILWTVLCLLHFVSLSVYIYLVASRLTRIVVLFEWLDFVDAL